MSEVSVTSTPATVEELEQMYKKTLKPNPPLFKNADSVELTLAAEEYFTALEFHVAHIPAASLETLLKKTQGSACELELWVPVVYEALDVQYAVNEELAMRAALAEMPPTELLLEARARELNEREREHNEQLEHFEKLIACHRKV